MTRLLGLLAGLILVAFVWWMLRELAKANGGHHAPMGGGPADPAPDDDPAHDPPNAE